MHDISFNKYKFIKSLFKNKVKNFSSSACAYNINGLIESSAYPAMPEDGYGCIYTKECRHFNEDFNLDTKL